jgi:hypothetical protein
MTRTFLSNNCARRSVRSSRSIPRGTGTGARRGSWCCAWMHTTLQMACRSTIWKHASRCLRRNTENGIRRQGCLGPQLRVKFHLRRDGRLRGAAARRGDAPGNRPVRFLSWWTRRGSGTGDPSCCEHIGADPVGAGSGPGDHGEGDEQSNFALQLSAAVSSSLPSWCSHGRRESRKLPADRIRRVVTAVNERKAGGRARRLAIDATNERYFSIDLQTFLGGMVPVELVISSENIELPGHPEPMTWKRTSATR